MSNALEIRHKSTFTVLIRENVPVQVVAVTLATISLAFVTFFCRINGANTFSSVNSSLLVSKLIGKLTIQTIAQPINA